MSKIGLQLYSIKEISEKNFLDAVKLTAESGYDGIEFAGYFETPAKVLKKTLDDLGLLACGTHTGFKELDENFNSVIEYNMEIGNTNIIIPSIDEDMFGSKEAWLKTAEKMNGINEKLKKYGIKLGYHNHDFEFVKFDGICGYDILADNTSDDILLEIDTFWVAYTGESVVEYIKKYVNRLELIHIKDMNADKISTEVGRGLLDFPAIVSAAEKTHWFIVEQEDFSIPQEESIKLSCDYLKGLLK